MWIPTTTTTTTKKTKITIFNQNIQAFALVCHNSVLRYVFCPGGKGTLWDLQKLNQDKGYREQPKSTSIICEIIDDFSTQRITLLATWQVFRGHIGRDFMRRNMPSQALAHSD
jgi:hypothetical protein